MIWDSIQLSIKPSHICILYSFISFTNAYRLQIIIWESMNLFEHFAFGNDFEEKRSTIITNMHIGNASYEMMLNRCWF